LMRGEFERFTSLLFDSLWETTMKTSRPYSLPAQLSRNIRRVLDYWDRLKRGGNTIPFWDDVNISALPDLSARLMLVDVFVKPERFRFNMVGEQLVERFGESPTGKFADQVELHGILEFFRSQCSATVEASEPTFYRHHRSQGSGDPEEFSRLLLPMWGDGHIGMLLGAIDWR